MKTTIYYFSGTGNSLKIAKEISKHIKNCEILSISQVYQNENFASDAENIGFVFPVYYFGMPLIVENFLKKINLEKTQYVFTVANYGLIAGRPITDFKNTLLNRNIKLNSGFKIRMPDNYCIETKIPDHQKQKKIFEKAYKKITKISEKIRKREDFIEKDNFLLKIITRSSNKKWQNKLPDIYKEFYFNDKCNSCDICERVCPVNNIEIDNGRPLWNKNCQECLACLHWCPKQAIQRNKKTENQGRYHHPDIFLKDMIR